MASARPLVLVLLLTTFVCLAVGGTCDSGRRRLREERLTDGGGGSDDSAGSDWPLSAEAFGSSNTNNNGTDGGGGGGYDDGDGNSGIILPPPSNPELTVQLTLQCNQCGTPGNTDDCVADLSKSCNASANFPCPACGLWRSVEGCLESFTRRDCGGQGPPVHYSPPDALHPQPARNWLIEPLEPLFGVENFMRGNAGRAAAACWTYGWDDAVRGLNERPQIAARDLIIVINSLAARTFHSMHFHVGTRSAAWRACASSLPLPPQGVWWRASCKNLSTNPTVVTEIHYLWPIGGRANINAAAKEGLAKAGNSLTAGVALVHYPNTADENLVVVFDGAGVSDYTLLA